METGYELFDHTADVGIRVYAPTLAGLVPAATAGLYATIGDLVPVADERGKAWSWKGEVSYDLAEEEDRGYRDLNPQYLAVHRGELAAGLLRDYLTAVLLLFETKGRMVTDVRVAEFDERRLAVEGMARAVDEGRSSYDREVKAVTYHELAVRQVEDGFEATVIVDI